MQNKKTKNKKTKNKKQKTKNKKQKTKNKKSHLRIFIMFNIMKIAIQAKADSINDEGSH